ncbi:sensor histidine kinase [Kitasatospora sp. NPDC059571]|uniref:sensor histidine kinase n=1 Tax=Kitasatospora sp. NPDC059571 TaxID=3346871 RepID=UPI0036B990C9
MLRTLLPNRTAPTGDGPASFRTVPGSPVENRRQLVVKLAWMSLWMIYLVYPVQDLTGHRHTAWATAAGAVALTGFVGCYLLLVARRTTGARPGAGPGARTNLVIAAAMLATALATSLTLGEAWLTLFTYSSTCVAVVLPPRTALAGVAGTTALALAAGLLVRADGSTLGAILLPCFLSGLAMTGLQRLIATMQELREARAAVAHLAASEERLRLARDLHDLLGHSLSLITIKSELAGRFLAADKPDDARAQVTDIEKVARQSLIDVREAVSGFRRPTLPVELAAARTALGTAQVVLKAAPEVAEGRPGLDPEGAGALAWALREAVTNIVRHGADATVCTVTMDESWEDDGTRYAVLEVADNGRGPGKSAPGNGLTGLSERLALVGGRLQTGTGAGGRGFRLRASVPLAAVPAEAPGGTVRG